MKISCKVMEDILPLYVEDCCSEDTKKLIEEHLLECEDCKEGLKKLSKPLFLSQESSMNEKTYTKHAKKAFGKIRRRLVSLILIILIILIPISWLGINEIKGEGVSYSSLIPVLRGNALLRALKNGNYEKAFSYLNLEAWYGFEIEVSESEEDSGYTQIKIGDDIYYINDEVYNNAYRSYLADEDEAAFWKLIYQTSNYMIPASKVELYLYGNEDFDRNDLMEINIDDKIYYIDGKTYNYDTKNAEYAWFSIMTEEQYNQLIELRKEAEKESKRIINHLIDMGYDGYVAEYKQQWIENFEQLKEEGITIVGYQIKGVYHMENRYQLDFQLKLNVDGEINYDYGVTFMAQNNGFYPSGGSVSGKSMENDRIPIISAFGHSINMD